MKTKEVRGITIISLVVTIVVLLILAGVSVSLVIGNNNLFDKAKSTQKVQTIAGIKEALELEKADIQVESKTVNLENYLEQINNASGGELTVNSDAPNIATASLDGNTVTVKPRYNSWKD